MSNLWKLQWIIGNGLCCIQTFYNGQESMVSVSTQLQLVSSPVPANTLQTTTINTEVPTANSNNPNSHQLPQTAAIAALALVATIFLALTLCLGVLLLTIIQREVGRRRHRRRRQRERQMQIQKMSSHGMSQAKKLPFAMKINEVYSVTPYQSATGDNDTMRISLPSTGKWRIISNTSTKTSTEHITKDTYTI